MIICSSLVQNDSDELSWTTSSGGLFSVFTIRIRQESRKNPKRFKLNLLAIRRQTQWPTQDRAGKGGGGKTWDPSIWRPELSKFLNQS